MERTVIFTPDGPSAPWGSSQAITYNGLLHVSGQLPIAPATGHMLPRPFNPSFGGGDQAVGDHTSQCLNNLDAICQAAGTDLSHALKLTIYTPVLIEFGSVIDHVCRDFFTDDPPARSMVGVAVLQGNALVQVDAVVSLT